MFSSVDCVWQSTNVLLLAGWCGKGFVYEDEREPSLFIFWRGKVPLASLHPSCPHTKSPDPFVTHGLAMYSLQRIT
jgi:hypothetical protein